MEQQRQQQKTPQKLPIKNPYGFELEKFINRNVIVIDHFGNRFEGVCRGIAANHLNVILATKTEKIIVKNIASMTRKRGLDSQAI